MKWIDIKDELPNNGDNILVNIAKKTKGDKVMYALFVTNPDRFYVNRWVEKQVSHWMKLPDPVDVEGGSS